MTVKFVIAKDGSVSKASVQESSLNSKTVESCIVGRLKRFTFPKPKDGLVIVKCPLDFQSE